MAIQNSFDVTYGYKVGLEAEGLSVGYSVDIKTVSFYLSSLPIPQATRTDTGRLPVQGWSRTDTITGLRSVTILANHAVSDLGPHMGSRTLPLSGAGRATWAFRRTSRSQRVASGSNSVSPRVFPACAGRLG